MATQMNIYEAKSHLSQLVDQAVAGEEVVIARAGKPVARLVPIERPPRRRQPGSLRGKIWLAPDFDETPPEILEAFYGDGPVDQL